jgi:type VI secretion system protein ImpK
MFASGEATLNTVYGPLLDRIGGALQDEPGRVLVVGHTDNQPIRTARFPSNWHLSSARAEAAREVIARAIGTGARVRSDGRGEAEPVATNATAEGRDENRRIEVQLVRAGS